MTKMLSWDFSVSRELTRITFHILDLEALAYCRQNEQDSMVICKTDFNDYLHTLWGEARRAWEEFGMLLIPGVEITNNTKGYHILAIDIFLFIQVGYTTGKRSRPLWEQ